jgi:hypothetical protein
MRDIMVNTEVINKAVQLACRAPSLHNSQPWHWVAEDGTVQLYLDKERILYSTDHLGREALIGCGAALDHFRVAMAAAGWTANVDWDLVESQLRRAVTSDTVRLDVIADELRPELAEASQLTESLRLYDSSYHAELSWWTGPFETREGIPHSSLVSAPESDRVDIGRNFPVTSNTDRRLGFGHDHSKILVLSTYDNERDSVLRCGETLSAVLLDATMAGLATCTLTHITELQASRHIVATLIDQTTTPQVLIRVGQIPQLEDVPPATPRRPIDEVFEVRSKDR